MTAIGADNNSCDWDRLLGAASVCHIHTSFNMTNEARDKSCGEGCLVIGWEDLTAHACNLYQGMATDGLCLCTSRAVVTLRVFSILRCDS